MANINGSGRFKAVSRFLTFLFAVMVALGLTTCDLFKVGLGKKVDINAPTITLTSHESGAYVKGPITLSGTCADDLGVTSVTVTAAGVETPFAADASAGTSWTLALDTTVLTDARTTFTATATDASGKSGSFEFLLFVDNTSPTVMVTSPLIYGPPDYPQQSDYLEVKGEVYDVSPITKVHVTVRNAAGTVLKEADADGSNTWTYRFNLKNTAGFASAAANGTYYYSVQATDKGGNVSAYYYHRKDVRAFASLAGKTFPSMDEIGEIDQAGSGTAPSGFTFAELSAARLATGSSPVYANFSFNYESLPDISFTNLNRAATDPSANELAVDAPITGLVVPPPNGGSVDASTLYAYIYGSEAEYLAHASPLVTLHETTSDDSDYVLTKSVGDSVSFVLTLKYPADPDGAGPLSAGDALVPDPEYFLVVTADAEGSHGRQDVRFSISSAAPILTETGIGSSTQSKNAAFNLSGTAVSSLDLSGGFVDVEQSFNNPTGPFTLVPPSPHTLTLGAGTDVAWTTDDLAVKLPRDPGNINVAAATNGSDDGLYYYRVTLTTPAGKKTSLERSVMYDTTGPTIVINSMNPEPASGTNKVNGVLAFSVGITDLNGIGEARWGVAAAEPSWADLSANVLASPYSGSVNTDSLSPGATKLWFLARDKAGNLSPAVSRDIDIDPATDNPAIALTNMDAADDTPAEASGNLQGTGAKVTGTLTDDDSIDSSTLQIRVDAGAWTDAFASAPADGKSVSFSYSFTGLTQGVHYYSLRVSDLASAKAGRPIATTTIGPVYFAYDTDDPTLTIADTSDAWHTSSFVLNGTALDTYGLKAVEVSYDNGSTWNAIPSATWTAPYPTASQNWSYDLAAHSPDLFDGSHEGPYDWQVRSIDAFDKTTALEFDFSVDTIIAEPAFTSPATGSFQTSSPVTVTGTASDGGSGIATIYFAVGATQPAYPGAGWTAASGTTTWNTQVAMAQGNQTVWARAVDLAGNTSSAASRSFLLDLAPPTIGNVLLDGAAWPGGSVYRGGAFTLSYDLADSFDLASVTIRQNGTNITPALPDLSGASDTAATMTVNVPSLASGTYLYVVTLMDGAGRTATDQKTITVDTTPPLADVVSVQPIVGTNTVNGNIALAFSASDNLSVQAIRYWVLASGSTPVWTTPGYAEITTPPYADTYDTGVMSGAYDVVVMARDQASNTSTVLPASRFALSIDQTTDNPTIDVTNMLEGGTAVQNLQGAGAKVVGTVTDDDMLNAATLQINVDGSGWTNITGYTNAKTINFEHSFTGLTQGPHSYQLRVSDLLSAKGGKPVVTTTLAAVAFAYDTAPPTLAIADTSDAWRNASFILNGTAEDTYGLNAVQLSFDGGSTWNTVGSWASVTGIQNWSYDISTYVPNLFDGSHEGTYNWQVRSVDAFNKTTALPFIFKVDTLISSPTIGSPAADSYFLAATGIVQGSSSDTGSGINAVYFAVAASEPTPPAVADRLSDAAWTAAGWTKANGSAPWVANLSGLAEGNRIVHIRSVDLAGNMSDTAVNRTFRVDLNNPTVPSILLNGGAMPADPVYRGAAFSLGFNLADTFDIASVSITQKMNAGSPLTIPLASTSNPDITGTNDVSALLTAANLPRNVANLSNHLLVTGTFEYEVTLTDGAGRTATSRKSIIVDIDPPVISIPLAGFNKFVTGTDVNGTVTFTTTATDPNGIAEQRYFITSTNAAPAWDAVEGVGDVVDILAGTSIVTTDLSEYADDTTYWLWAMAEDNSGLTGTSASVEFHINQDSDKPILNLDSTINETVLDASTILSGGNVFDGTDRISGIVTDDDAVSNIYINVWNDLGALVVNAAACTLGGTSTNRSFYYNLNGLVDDTYYFTIDAVDDHGVHNVAMAPDEIWFAVDKALPTIANDHIRLENRYATSVAVTAVNASDTFTTGAAHGLAAGDAVMFSASLYGVDAATKYYVRSAGLTSTAFTVATSRGGALVPLTGDGAGLSIAYMTKNAAAMPNAKLYNNFRVYVQASDDSGIAPAGVSIVLEGYGNYALPVNGSFTNESGNLWYYDVAIDEGGHADDGSLTMTITASDVWENEREAVLQVTIDTRPPEPVFSSFADDQAVNGSAVPVIGTINDPSPGVGVAYWNIAGGLLNASLASGTGNSWNTAFDSNTYANASNATVDGIPVTVDTATEFFDMAAANGIANGDEVYFYAGTYPSNIFYGTVYYVINFNGGTDSFQVCADRGGTTPVDLGGTPLNVVVREGGIRWLFPVTTTCFDQADNRDNPSLDLYLDPIGDRPRIGNTLLPTTGSYAGTINIIGSVNDDDLPAYVDVCADLNDDGVITNGAYPHDYGGTPGTADAFEEEDNYFRINMTGYSFSGSINDANQFSRAIMEARGVAAPGTATGYFRLRFIAYDVNGTASNPVWVRIYLDDSDPTIGGLNYASGSGTLVHGTVTLSGYVEDDSVLDSSNLRFNINNAGYSVAPDTFAFDNFYSGMRRYNFTKVIDTTAYDNADNTGTVKVAIRVMDGMNQYNIENVNFNADNKLPSAVFNSPPSMPQVGANYDFNGPGGSGIGTRYQIIGTAGDTGAISGVDYVLVYFVKGANFYGPRHLADLLAVGANTATVRSSDLDLNYDGDGTDPGESVGSDQANVPVPPMTLDSTAGPSGYISSTMTTLAPDKLSMTTPVTGNAYLQPGWIVQFAGGEQRTVSSYDSVTGRIGWATALASTPANGSAIAIGHLRYYIKIDKRTELGAYDATAGIGDGDGFNESLKAKSGYDEWSTFFNSTLLPEGQITVYYMICDEAGNRVYQTASAQVSNNPPTIGALTSGGVAMPADLRVKHGGTVSFTMDASDPTGSIDPATYALTVAKKFANSGGAYGAEDTSFTPFYYGVNAGGRWIRDFGTKSGGASGSAALSIMTRGALVTAGSFVVGQTYEIATLNGTNYSLIDPAATGTVGTLFTATNNGASNGAGTAYQDDGFVDDNWYRCVAEVKDGDGNLVQKTFNMLINNNDSARPVITQFHDFTQASVVAGHIEESQKRKILSSQVDIDNNLINLELPGFAEEDPVQFAGTSLPSPLAPATTYYIESLNLAAKTFRVSSTAGGSAINLTTTGSGTFTIQRVGGTSVASLSGTVMITGQVYDDTAVTGVTVEIDVGSGYVPLGTVVPTFLSGDIISGKTYSWALEWNTAKQGLTTVALNGVKLRAYGTDTLPTDVADRPELTVNVVPYISGLTQGGKALARTHLGKYPAREGATGIVVSGYNINGALGTSGLITIKNAGLSRSLNLNVTARDNVDYLSATVSIPSTAYSGYLYATTNSVNCLNNSNDDALVQNKESVSNQSETDHWTDTRYVQMWTTGISFDQSDAAEMPAMALNPNTKQLAGGWLNRNAMAAYWANMNGTRSGNIVNGTVYDPSEYLDMTVDTAGNARLSYLWNEYTTGGTTWQYFRTWTQSGPTSTDIERLGDDNVGTPNHTDGMDEINLQFQNGRIATARISGTDYAYVSYYDSWAKCLKYAVTHNNATPDRASRLNATQEYTVVDGMDWFNNLPENQTPTADTSDVGLWSSIAVDQVGGADATTAIPVIMYFDSANQKIKIARGLVSMPNSARSGGWDIHDVIISGDYTFGSGQYVSMKLDSAGNIHAVCYNSESGNLLYLYANNLNGAGGQYDFSIVEEVDPNVGAGVYADITLLNDVPYISYVYAGMAGTTKGLKFAYKAGANGTPTKWEYGTVPSSQVVNNARTSVEAIMKTDADATATWARQNYATDDTLNVAIGFGSTNFGVVYLRPED